MGKKRYIAVGIVFGMIIATAVQIYAVDAASTVTAFLRDNFKIEYNGQAKEMPEEYSILVYENRTYLPVRYISELLNCNIDWNDTTKTISIKQEVNNADNADPGKIDTTVYGKIPQSVETLDYRITAFYLGDDAGEKNRYKLYLRLENKAEDILRLDQSSVKYTIDGKAYSISSLPQDSTWNTAYLNKKDEIEGYICLPQEANAADHLSILLNLTRDGESKPIPVNFSIQLK